MSCEKTRSRYSRGMKLHKPLAFAIIAATLAACAAAPGNGGPNPDNEASASPKSALPDASRAAKASPREIEVRGFYYKAGTSAPGEPFIIAMGSRPSRRSTPEPSVLEVWIEREASRTSSSRGSGYQTPSSSRYPGAACGRFAPRSSPPTRSAYPASGSP